MSAALLALLAAVLTGLHMTVNPGFSPLDEATHADYALRLSQGELPAAGDPLSQQVLDEWSCRGSATGKAPLPACGSAPYDPAAYPALGLQYNAGHPPLYYAVTGVVARVVVEATGVGFVGAARLTGVLWLTAGLWLLLAALRRLGASWTLATAGAALVALAPAVLHPSSIVNNDAAAVLAGALALWVALRVLHGDSSWPAFAAAAAVVAALKVIFVVALVPAGVLLLLRLWRAPQDRRRLAVALGAGVVASVGTTVAWAVVQAGRADPDAVNPLLGVNTEPAEHVPVAAIVRNAFAAWPPVDRPFLLAGVEEPSAAAWSALLILVLGSAPVLGLLAARSVLGRDLAIGVVAGMVSVPVAVQLFSYASEGYYFPGVGPRYGLALVPALVLALVAGVPDRTGERVLAGLAGLGTACLLFGLVYAL